MPPYLVMVKRSLDQALLLIPGGGVGEAGVVVELGGVAQQFMNFLIIEAPVFGVKIYAAPIDWWLHADAWEYRAGNICC